MKRLLVLHGWGADSRSNWFPWLKATMEEKGHNVYCPDLPDTETPNLERWLRAAEIAAPFDRTLSAVGHSLGGTTLLRLLEKLGESEKIETAVFVSGFAADIGIEELQNFVEKPFDWEKIRKKAKRFIVMHSDDDPVVPVALGKEIASRLKATFITEHGCGHLNAGIGDFTYPRIVDALEEKL